MISDRASVARIAADHLRATDNPAVGWGDVHLLHEIAEKSGIETDGPGTEKRVLDAIERSNQGDLKKVMIQYHRRVRRFYLPECEPEWITAPSASE